MIPIIALVGLLIRPGATPSWLPWMLAGWLMPVLYLAHQYWVYGVGPGSREARAETVVKRVTDAIVQVDQNWRFTRVDERAEEIYGRTEEELLGRHFWKIFPQALGTEFEEVYRGVMQSREPGTLEAYNVDLDGWFHVAVYPDEDGGLSFYFRDVTEEHALKEEVQAEKNLLEQAQRLAGAWSVDLRTDEISWSDQVYRIHELPVGTEVDLEESIEFYAPGARETIREVFDRAVTEGRSYDLELPLLTARGNRRWVRTVGAPVRVDGEVVKIAGAVQDITERRSIERQNRLLASALEAAANAIVITDRNHVIRWVNPAFTELTGYSAEEVVGWKREMFQPEGQNSALYEDLRETIRTGSVWHGELVSKRKDGSEYVEEQTVTPVRGEDGEIHHFIAVKQDVTEQKEYEEKLRLAKEEAEQMNRLKSSFLANMSHEIRTPLTSIIGYADLLKSRMPSADDTFVDRIEQSGHRLLRTLDSVLDLAQLESGNVQVHPEVFDCVEEIRGIADSLQLQARRSDIAYRVDLPEGPLRVTMDKGALTRIVTNLIENAIKYTEEGFVRITCEPIDDEIVIEVEDTGIGMEDEFLGDLYKAFQQETMGITRRFEGNGLGLTITKNLVDLLGGSIEVESKKGVGTTFVVALPRHTYEAD
jgi:PAS domain S-box-containing protein